MDDESVDKADDGLHEVRVLVVDNTHADRVVINKALSKQGISVSLAEDGEEAIRAIECASNASAFHLILMDIKMPVMDGLTATRLIRGLGHTMPIIAYTADIDMAKTNDCRDAGITDIVIKPIPLPELLEKIWYWLGVEGAKQ